jgi:hypothetical protein
LLLLSEIYVYTFQEKFLTTGDDNLSTAARRADEIPVIHREIVFAVGTVEAGGKALEIQRCAFGYGVFGDDVPVELDRVVYDAGEFPDDQIQLADTARARFLRVIQGDVENTLRNAEFMHGWAALAPRIKFMIIELIVPCPAARPSDKCHLGERLESLVNPLRRGVGCDDDHENDDQAQQQGEGIFAREEFFED